MGMALVVIGLLSRRLGEATRAAPYHIGFYVAAGLVLVSVLARLFNLLFVPATVDDPLWIALYSGLPALAVTIGVFVAWRYWSWLLAERD